MKILKIKGFRFNELSEKAQSQVICDFFNNPSFPLDYEDDNGNICYDYFSDWAKDEQIDFCLENNYYFNKSGSLIKGVL